MPDSHNFSPVILREYDIRGTVGNNLNPADALALGRAFGTMVVHAGGKRIMVGYDGRTHSPLLEAALVEGLLSTGLQIERIGLGPTPMLYFSVFSTHADAGIMVTGSHNPPDQNGFKMLLGKHLPTGGPIYGKAVQQLGVIAAAGGFVQGTGSAKDVDVRDAYIQRLLVDFHGTRDLKVAWDAGNGAGGEIIQRLVKLLPGEHIVLFPEIDGRFPNHHPDPSVPDNLRDLQATVLKHKCDLGVAFDGDADRIGAVDGRGRILAGDQLLAVYAGEVLRNHQGATIIADVKTSQVFFDFVAARGGKPLMWKSGNSLIKVKMAETNAPLAGEMSGHIFFADKYYGYDDAIYCAVRLLSRIASESQSLVEMLDELPVMMSTPEMQIKVPEERKFVIVQEIKAALERDGVKYNDIDGVRVQTPDGWWLLRASNTQAALSARAESSDAAGLERLKEALTQRLAACGVITH